MTREQIEDKTWEGAVAYVRDMAKTIRNLTQRFVADGAISELATVRAEALEECADGMERAAKKARAALPASSPAAPAEQRCRCGTESTGPYLCACTCGCVGRTIRPGRCKVCRVRQSCLKTEWTCEACAAGYRIGPWGVHYDHDDSTWGVCRKIVSSFRRAEP